MTEAPTKRLDKRFLRQAYPGQALGSLTSVKAAGQELTEVAPLAAACAQLKGLDVSSNALSHLDGVRDLPHLQWLSAAHNRITRMPPCVGLASLQVLNLGDNRLEGVISLPHLPSLAALMLNKNQITGVEGLAGLPALNTLVLKQNALRRLRGMLAGCGPLRTLSLAHNPLRSLKGQLAGCPGLTQLRLSHNPRLREVPASLGQLTGLQLLDLGNNEGLGGPSTLEVLSGLTALTQLTLKGSPPATAPGYPSAVLSALPSLRVLDTRRVNAAGQHTGAGRPGLGKSAEGGRAGGAGEVAGDRKSSHASPDARSDKASGRAKRVRPPAAEDDPAAAPAKKQLKRGAKRQGQVEAKALPLQQNKREDRGEGKGVQPEGTGRPSLPEFEPEEAEPAEKPLKYRVLDLGEKAAQKGASKGQKKRKDGAVKKKKKEKGSDRRGSEGADGVLRGREAALALSRGAGTGSQGPGLGWD